MRLSEESQAEGNAFASRDGSFYIIGGDAVVTFSLESLIEASTAGGYYVDGENYAGGSFYASTWLELTNDESGYSSSDNSLYEWFSTANVEESQTADLKVGLLFEDGDWGSVWAEAYTSAEAEQVGAVPVPAALWLFGTSLVGLLGFTRRRQI